MNFFQCLAAVERDEQAELRAHEQQPRIVIILPQRVDVSHLGQVARHVRPRPAVIGGLEQIRLPIVVAMVIERHVSRGGVEMRRLDARNLHVTLGRIGEVIDDVGESLAAILAQLQIAIVGADPNDAWFGGRFAHLRRQRTGRIPVVLFGHRLVARSLP